MAFLRAADPQWRAPYTGRAYIADTYRGLLRVRKWPRARGLPKQPWARANLELHRLYLQLYMATSELELAAMRAAIIEHNQTHRGVRGSAAIRQRDWEYQRLRGRGLAIETTAGRVLYPPAVARDASHLLDHLSDVPGALAHRTTDRWAGASACRTNTVLTMTLDTCIAGCCPADADVPESCALGAE